MTPERWARIKGVFSEALQRDGEERQAFLDESCGEDAELRQEVESLLHGREDVTQLRSPVNQEDWIGKKISRYRIIERLGAGGMGVVYEAKDTTLHRSVALKLLPAATIGDPAARTRFQKEAEAAAALDHPNITTVYEVGEEAGQSFIAMAFVDGKALAERIAERPLPLPEALEIASQVAAALEAAHER
ncbi:MAG: serine/threonine protein kinase, partial [bacterium]|nr:serine/threonine protein kinase [bacterium]